MEYSLIRSKRKTISIEVNVQGEVKVRAPFRVKIEEIDNFVMRKSDWIEKALLRAKEKRDKCNDISALTSEELNRLVNEARVYIKDRVRYYANMMGVSYEKIVIKTLKSRWGSCSSKKNLNFNCLLMLAPIEVRDYVIVHELCHLKEMNHSYKFWNEVEKVIPNYRESKIWLKENGNKLIMRIR